MTTAYKTLWKDSELQCRIDSGIEHNRKSDGTVRITDFYGKPLEGVTIRAKQHDALFHFGANIFNLNGFVSDALNRRYEEAFCALFNGATVPFYWRTLEPEQDRPRYAAGSVPIARRPAPDVVTEFCQKHGLRMHGHPLVWNFRKWSLPDWLPEDPVLSEALWEKRIRQIAERYGHVIKRWDALNEAIARYPSPFAYPMPEDYERKAFGWAEKYLPREARLDINEATSCWTNGLETYTAFIRRLINEGSRIGGIGLQFHLFADEDLHRVLNGEKFSPLQLFQVLDHYGSAFERPLHISEITLTSPENTAHGLEAQAEVARNFYRLWFSHPAVEGITWWNLPDGGAAPGEDKVHSGLLFEDLTPKPAYQALRDLVRKEWRTETSGATDADGCFHFRGFHGSYLVQTAPGIESALTLEPGKRSDLLIRL